jgi:hypothetical protein
MLASSGWKVNRDFHITATNEDAMLPAILLFLWLKDLRLIPYLVLYQILTGFFPDFPARRRTRNFGSRSGRDGRNVLQRGPAIPQQGGYLIMEPSTSKAAALSVDVRHRKHRS